MMLQKKKPVVMQLNDLSVYRTELMGWSIVWIMMLHFGFCVLKPLGFLAQYGYAGVDIFMFVSGFGLFFSLDKKPSVIDFYRRRFFRIFPTYFVIGLLASGLIFHDNVLSYLYRFSTLGFWIGGIYAEWYVPSIVMLYILAPLFRRIGPNWQTVLALVLLVISLFLVERPDLIDGSHYFFLYRVPAFLYGMICARWLQQGRSMKWFCVMVLTGLPFFVWLYPQHHQVYMYKYLSVLFLLPFFICAFVLISKYISFFTPVMRRIGQASLEIYLTQYLFFILLIRDVLERSDVTTIVLIMLCSIAGWLLHEALQGRLRYLFPTILIYGIVSVCIYYALKWQPLLTPVKPKAGYQVSAPSDDSLRIVMYGDSWAGLHPCQIEDSVIAGRPVSFVACGHGGFKSGEVYELMFSHRQYLEKRPDYVVIIAGINDAHSNIGTHTYVTNYLLMVRHLLACGTRPVVVELPDVDLATAYCKKPLKDRLADLYRAFITASGCYDVADYRDALHNALLSSELMDSVLYVLKDRWNPKGYIENTIYLNDGIHLNSDGYQRFDSCIVSMVRNDMETI